MLFLTAGEQGLEMRRVFFAGDDGDADFFEAARFEPAVAIKFAGLFDLVFEQVRDRDLAAFCSEESYEAHYGGVGDYLDQRKEIAKRYFGGDMSFDAMDAIRKYQPLKLEGDFTESDIGEDNL